MSARELRIFAVLGFASTHDALDAEATLKRGDIDVVPIPAPKSLGSLCGIALRIAVEDVVLAQEQLQTASIVITATSEIEDV